MRRAINSATSPADLQARLNSAGGPSLSLANLATPFPVLRPKLLASLEQAKLNALEQFSSSKPSMIWSLLQRCFHVILSAVGYGLGFAASAQRPDSELTVLQEWKRALNKRKRQAVSMQTLLNERESWLGLRNGRRYLSALLSARGACIEHLCAAYCFLLFMGHELMDGTASQSPFGGGCVGP